MEKALIINAHQKYEGIAEGKLNQSMVDIMKQELEAKGFEVKLTNIEQGYDAQEEVEKHIWADLIITQSPVYWFSSPWIYKKYIDEVFTAGYVAQSFLADDGRVEGDASKQYGTGGKMQGKKYMVSLTWNAPGEAFGDVNQYMFEGKTVDDYLIYNTGVYKFCGVEILPAFSCHDVMKHPNMEKYTEEIKAHLNEVL